MELQETNSYLNERVSQLNGELTEAKELITAHQIAKDNLELRLHMAVGFSPRLALIPRQVY